MEKICRTDNQHVHGFAHVVLLKFATTNSQIYDSSLTVYSDLTCDNAEYMSRSMKQEYIRTNTFIQSLFLPFNI